MKIRRQDKEIAVKRLFVLVTMAFLTVRGFALTLGEIETEVRRNVRDTQATVGLERYPDTILDVWINETQKDVNNKTWAVDNSTTVALLANTTYYVLPDNFLAATQVLYTNSAGLTVDMPELSARNVYQAQPDYERSSKGTPGTYFIRGQLSGAYQEIAFLPIPTTSGGTVQIQYQSQPADLAVDADVPFDGIKRLYPYHYTLVWGTTMRIKLIEGRGDEAKIYADLYNADIATMKEKLGLKPNYNPSLRGAPR